MTTPTCPKCEKKVIELKEVCSGQSTAKVRLDYKKNVDFSHYENTQLFSNDGFLLEYRCPHCGHVISKTLADALNFLTGERSNKETRQDVKPCNNRHSSNSNPESSRT